MSGVENKLTNVDTNEHLLVLNGPASELSLTDFLHNNCTIDEIVERLRRVDFSLEKVSDELEPQWLKKISLRMEAERVYNKYFRRTNASLFYYYATLIRRHNDAWELYVSDATNDIPEPLRPLTDNKVLSFCFAALDILGVINLDPAKTFVAGNPIRGIISMEIELTSKHIENILLIWDMLGRPQLGRRNDFLTVVYRMSFSPNFKRNFSWYCVNYFQSFLMGINELLNNEYFVPIKISIDNTNDRTLNLHYTINFWSMIDNASFTMAFDSNGIDTLDSINELFPEYPEFIAEIIHAYYYRSTVPRDPTDNFAKLLALREVLYEHFLGGKKISIFGGWGEVHHRGALKHLDKFPGITQEFMEHYCVLIGWQRTKYHRNPSFSA